MIRKSAIYFTGVFGLSVLSANCAAPGAIPRKTRRRSMLQVIHEVILTVNTNEAQNPLFQITNPGIRLA
jgi:hypothetical protein